MSGQFQMEQEREREHRKASPRPVGQSRLAAAYLVLSSAPQWSGLANVDNVEWMNEWMKRLCVADRQRRVKKKKKKKVLKKAKKDVELLFLYELFYSTSPCDKRPVKESKETQRCWRVGSKKWR